MNEPEPNSAVSAPASVSSTPQKCPHCQATLSEQLSICPQCGLTPEVDKLSGKTIDGRYHVVRLLGSGAMGSVYEVRHLRLDKRFAMKVIHSELSRVPEFVARFEREALSTSKLHHPNCISVTDFGHASTGELYLVMEFLEGQTLIDLMAEPTSRLPMLLDIARQVLLGLQHAHHAGVVHRDIKPENVMCIHLPDGKWQAKIVDFGIAKLPFSGQQQERLTRAGVIFGTPQYMAPEQVLGGEVDERADIYGVGVIIWRMVTKRPLFEFENYLELLSTKISQPAPRLSETFPGYFSPAVDELLCHALERKPEDRYSSTAEMITALDQVLMEPHCGQLLGDRPLEAPTGEGRPAKAASPASAKITVGSPNTPRGGAISQRLIAGLNKARRPDRATLARRRRIWMMISGTVAGVALAGTLLHFLFGLPSGPTKTSEPTVAATPPANSANNANVAKPKSTAPSKKKPALAPTPSAAASTTNVVATEPAPKVAPAPHENYRRARNLINRGACAQAEKELRQVLEEKPRQAQARFLLGAALICKKSYADGLAQYSEAIHLDDSIRQEKRLLDDAQKVLQNNKTKEQAVRFLIDEVGQPALPLLIKIASYNKNAKLRDRAAAYVTRQGAEDKIDKLSRYSLDLQQGDNCKERSEAVSRLRALKDPRALPALRQARWTRTGFFGLTPKNACIMRQLNDTIEYLQDLEKKK